MWLSTIFCGLLLALATKSSALTWPNEASSRNSDSWLSLHHADIDRVNPKLLVVNFANPTLGTQKAQDLVHTIIAGLAEGSRYHGYNFGTKVGPQLEYQIAKFVNLRDGDPGFVPPPPGYPFQNSRQYPRKPPGSQGAWGLDYAALFNSTYAAWFGFRDRCGKVLGLCELVNRGMINELWLVGSADVPDVNGAEVLELKQMYDSAGHKIPGAFNPCAGNGCFDSGIPNCGRSFRIGWVNYNRGPGCYMHSYGHGIENAGGRSSIVPQWSKWVVPFGKFNLDQPPLNLPFQSLYGVGCDATAPNTCVEHPTPTSAIFHNSGNLISKDDVDFVCGNVHFPPNGRSHYDYENVEQSVLSSCTSFGQKIVARSTVNATLWQKYDAQYGDCGGGFLTWWYQNMPWHGSHTRNADGSAMLSPGPFLFY